MVGGLFWNIVYDIFIWWLGQVALRDQRWGLAVSAPSPGFYGLAPQGFVGALKMPKTFKG
jgi:hypothetical protein